VHESAEVGADVIGPKDNGQDASPETQMQIANGEEPRAAPGQSHEGVLLDLNFLRVFCAVVGCHDILRRCALRVAVEQTAPSPWWRRFACNFPGAASIILLREELVAKQLVVSAWKDSLSKPAGLT
jgi:hypothetical protein